MMTKRTYAKGLLALALLLTLVFGCITAASAALTHDQLQQIIDDRIRNYGRPQIPVTETSGTIEILGDYFSWSDSSHSTGDKDLTGCTFNGEVGIGENSFTIPVTFVKLPFTANMIDASTFATTFTYGDGYPGAETVEATDSGGVTIGVLNPPHAALIPWGTQTMRLYFVADENEDYWDTHEVPTSMYVDLPITVGAMALTVSNLPEYRATYTGATTASYSDAGGLSFVEPLVDASDMNLFKFSTNSPADRAPGRYNVSVTCNELSPRYSITNTLGDEKYIIGNGPVHISSATLGKTYNGAGQAADIVFNGDVGQPIGTSYTAVYSGGTLSGGLPMAAATDYSVTISLTEPASKYYVLTGDTTFSNLAIDPLDVAWGFSDDAVPYNRSVQEPTITWSPMPYGSDIPATFTITPDLPGNTER